VRVSTGKHIEKSSAGNVVEGVNGGQGRHGKVVDDSLSRNYHGLEYYTGGRKNFLSVESNSFRGLSCKRTGRRGASTGRDSEVKVRLYGGKGTAGPLPEQTLERDLSSVLLIAGAGAGLRPEIE